MPATLRKPRRIEGTKRGEQLRNISIRERRLRRVLGPALKEINRILDPGQLRVTWMMGSPPQIADRIEAVLRRVEDELVSALALPIRKQEEFDLPTSPETLARRQIGELIQGLGPRQLRTIREQLAVLMEDGPREEILSALSETTGLTERQARAVANHLRRNLEGGMSRGAAERAARNYAARLLQHRARLIARNEAVTYTNQVVQARGEAVGNVQKQWLSARDNDVDKIYCAVLDNDERIAIREEFVVTEGPARGEVFRHPPAHVGCRCLIELWRL